MVKTCKYPDKPCEDRFRRDRGGVYCRLTEWKKKVGVCPYDPTIRSSGHHKKIPPEQQKI